MAAQYSKENEKIQTPTEELQTPTVEPQAEEPITWAGALQQGYNSITPEYESMLQSRGDIYKQKAAERSAYQQKLNDAQQLYMDALNNKESVMGALLQKQKPVYDAGKEKRLRNNAIIQSFGDLLTEATKGAFAYNKKNGAGVYIPREKDYALNDINEINRMREEYLKRNEAWKALDYEMEAENAVAKVAGADALRTTAEEELKEASKAEEDAKNDYIKGAEAYLKERRVMIEKLIDAGREEEASAVLSDYRAKQLELGLYRAQVEVAKRAGTTGRSSEEEIKRDKYLVANIAYALGLVTDDDLKGTGQSLFGDEFAKQYNLYTAPMTYLENIYTLHGENPIVQLGILLYDNGADMEKIKQELSGMDSVTATMALGLMYEKQMPVLQAIKSVKELE